MVKTTAVNINKSEYDVYIGRAGKGQDGYWGNPFTIGRDGDRLRILALYRAYFNNRIINDPEFFERLQLLIGKRLGCFCNPKSCHGDIMRDYLNIEPKVKPYVDKLISAGFSTFSSCDGGGNHSFERRTIRINVCNPSVDDPFTYLVSQYGEEKCFARFVELCNFVESQGWTYCMVRLVRSYVVRNTNKPEASVHFELIWN